MRSRFQAVGTTDWYWTLTRHLSSAQTLSCDLFDTLVTRHPYNQLDIFEAVAKTINDPSFTARRVEAEKRASSRIRKHGSEYTINDIYNLLPEDPDIEMGLHSQFLHPVQPVVDIATQFQADGGRFIVVSDFYIGSMLLKSWLSELNINPDDIYVSCDLGATKNSGLLFKKLIDLGAMESKGTVHIGDDVVGDYHRPRQQHIPAIWRSPDRNKLELAAEKTPKFKETGDDCSNKANLSKSADEWLTGDVEFWARTAQTTISPGIYDVFDWLKTVIAPDEEVILLGRDLFALWKIYGDSLSAHYFPSSRRAALSALAAADINAYREMTNHYGAAELVKNGLPNFDVASRGQTSGLHADTGQLEALRSLWPVDRSKKQLLVELGWSGTIPNALIKALNLKNGRVALVGRRSKLDPRVASLRYQVDLTYYTQRIRRRRDFNTVTGIVEASLSEPEPSVQEYIFDRHGRPAIQRYPLTQHDRVRNAIATSVQDNLVQGSGGGKLNLFESIPKYIRTLGSADLVSLSAIPIGTGIGDRNVFPGSPSAFASRNPAYWRIWSNMSRDMCNYTQHITAQQLQERVGWPRLVSESLYLRSRLVGKATD
jgi:FMN phosphatase YigB (HAD superfamily)